MAAPLAAGAATGRTALSRRAILVGVGVILGGILVFATHARDAKVVLRINYCSKMHQWDELLEVAQRHPQADREIGSRRQINRALFETGQLGSRAFAFRQSPDSLLPMASGDIGFGLEDDLLALGSVNRAEHLAAESLSGRGATPHTLRVLARVFMAKGEPAAAKVFLTYLTKDIVHRRWAREALAKLSEAPERPADLEVQHIRGVMQQDPRLDAWGIDVELLRLLTRNARNRMAFEYLMAYCLIVGDLDCATEYLARGLRTVRYDVLPTHYAEAVILHEYLRTGQPPDFRRLPIDPSTALLGQRAIAIMARYGDDEIGLAKAMAAALPDSYCCYYFTRRVGRGPD